MLGKPSRRLKKHLEENGKKANAVVVEIAKRGMAITNGAEGVISNTTLELKTKIRVEPTGEPAFELEKRFRYGQLSVPGVGQRIGVIYDPEDHDKIMLDESAPFGGSAGFTSTGVSTDPASLLAQVQQAQTESGGDTQQLAALLRERLGGNVVVEDGGTQVFGTPFTMASSDPLDRLEKLGKLHKEGVLTDAEFEAQKAKILGEGS